MMHSLGCCPSEGLAYLILGVCPAQAGAYVGVLAWDILTVGWGPLLEPWALESLVEDPALYQGMHCMRALCSAHLLKR